MTFESGNVLMNGNDFDENEVLTPQALMKRTWTMKGDIRKDWSYMT